MNVWATAPEMAPASNLRNALGFFSPSFVRYFRTDSYTMKFKPTCPIISNMPLIKRDNGIDDMTYVWRNTSYRGNNATVQRRHATLRPIHAAHCFPHAGQLFRPLAQLSEAGRLDG